MLVAILTLAQATLTLPGIAGIILTLAVAVDANVLIYERIRDEEREGLSPLSAVDIRLPPRPGLDHGRQHHHR